MAYIGRPLNAGNLAVQSGTGDGADTTPIATLDYSVGSSNSIGVYLDGVRQLAGTDFTASGTTLTFTTAPANLVGIDVYFLGLELSIPTPADVSVTAAKLASNAVTTVKIIDDAVTLAKMAPGTDGNIISYDASGNPVAIATGSNGQVLTSTGAGSPPAFEALPAGGWAFVSSATASTSALLSFTNMVDGYDYEYVVENMKSASNAVHLVAQLGIAGPTYRTSGYLSTSTAVNTSSASQALTATAHLLLSCTETMGTTGSEELWRATMTLTNPAGTTNKTGCMGTMSVYGASPQNVPGLFGGAYNTAAEAHTSIKFFMDSGNIASGEIYQYRRARS